MSENIEKISDLRVVGRDGKAFEKRKLKLAEGQRRESGCGSGSDSVTISDEARRLLDEKAAADETRVK